MEYEVNDMKTVTLKLSSVTPLIMHNGQLANPMNPISLEMKKISGKRNKTESDLTELARLEFVGGLYPGDDGSPAIPGKVVIGTLRNGARKVKSGKRVEAGVFARGPFPLLYQGPRTPMDLWSDESFRLQEIVTVGQAKIVRTRPIFRDWAVQVELQYNENVVNEKDLVEWLSIAGEQVGIGDWRTGGYGLFTVEKI